MNRGQRDRGAERRGSAESGHTIDPRRRRRQAAGLTLVELLVTLVVAALVAGSTFVLFVGQRRSYGTQMEKLNAQQNLWAAMEMVTRNARIAGMGLLGCVKPDTDGPGPDLADPPPITGSAGGAPLTGLRAARNSGYRGPAPAGYPATGQTMRLAPLWIADGGDGGGPDSLTVVYGTGSSGSFADAPLGLPVATTTWKNAFNVPGWGAAFAFPGEFGILVDQASPALGPPPGDRGCTLFQISAQSGDSISHGAAPRCVWNHAATPSAPTPMVPFTYTASGASGAGLRAFGQLNWLHFFIQDTAGGSCPAVAGPNGATLPPACLMVEDLAAGGAPALLAEGVEDMQIAFACDVLPTGIAPAPDGDGVLTEDHTPNDEWIYNNDGDVGAGVPVNAAMRRCNLPAAVRVTLIARSTEPDQTIAPAATAGVEPAAENGARRTVTDALLRRTVTAVAYPRNR